MATQDGERFDVGRVAARTFGVIGRHPILFIGVALLFSGLPTLARGLLNAGGSNYAAIGRLMDQGGSPSGVLFAALGGLLYFILTNLMQTSLVVATLQDLSGRRVDFGVCVVRALRLLMPLIGLSIVAGALIVFGLLVLIVPGVILYLMWFVAAPVLVEERRGVLAALDRSAALTAGARWPIFGLVVLFLIFSGALALAQQLLLSLSPSVATTVEAATSTLSSLIASTGVAATYVELRTVKEGADVDALAAVFS